MLNTTTFVGLDVHARSIKAVALDAMTGEVRSATFGYDAANDKFGDMIAMGIVDPTKVTRSALENAASVSSILLTTEACVADKPEPPAPAPAGAPDMGGMY
mgnify:CR=1 FL=1